MSEPKRHHLLPAFYLARFADAKGHISVHSRATGKTFVTSVSNACVEAGFYTLPSAEQKEAGVVESTLSRVEGTAARVVKQITLGDFPLGDEDRSGFAVFMGLQMTRGRRFRHQIEAIGDIYMKIQFSNLTRNDVRNKLQSAKGRPPTDEEIGAAMYAVQNINKVRFTPPKNDSLRMMLELAAKELAPRLATMQWNLLYSRKPRFLTSDEPIVPWKEQGANADDMGYGIANADQVLFPLDPHHSLMLTHHVSSPDRYFVVESTDVRFQNRLVASECYELVFFRPKTNLMKGIQLPRRRPLLSVTAPGLPFLKQGDVFHDP